VQNTTSQTTSAPTTQAVSNCKYVGGCFTIRGRNMGCAQEMCAKHCKMSGGCHLYFHRTASTLTEVASPPTTADIPLSSQLPLPALPPLSQASTQSQTPPVVPLPVPSTLHIRPLFTQQSAVEESLREASRQQDELKLLSERRLQQTVTVYCWTTVRSSPCSFPWHLLIPLFSSLKNRQMLPHFKKALFIRPSSSLLLYYADLIFLKPLMSASMTLAQNYGSALVSAMQYLLSRAAMSSCARLA